MQYLSFCDCLSSLTIRFSRFIHVVTFGKIPFLFNDNIPLYVYNTYSLFIYKWTFRFHILAVLNSTAMNM